jgi:hypothetical protein
MDRNERARLMWRAEALERKTKRKRCRNGVLGYTGIAILRIIAFRFWNASKRAAWPSYDKLQEVSGLSRQAVADAIDRLETAGVMLVTRRAGWINGRIVRESNLYRLPEPPPPPIPADHESLRRERDKLKTSLSSVERPARDLLDAALASYEARMKTRCMKGNEDG